MGKVISIWGSPNSGKTAFATTLGTAIYDTFQTTVAVIYPDLDTPMLSCLFPNEKPKDYGSLGEILSKTEIDGDTVSKNVIVTKARPNLVFMGYKAGENKFTYPKYGRAKAEDFLEYLCTLADYVIVDCPTSYESCPLSVAAMSMSEQIIRLASPDLKCLSWYISQAPIYSGNWEKHIQGINSPDGDVFMPIEEARSHLGEVSFTVPYSKQLKEQMQKGTLCDGCMDKIYTSRMREIAAKVVSYGQE